MCSSGAYNNCTSQIKAFHKSHCNAYVRVHPDTHRIDCGLLQGFILGPVFFIFNMDDIFNVSKLILLFNMLMIHAFYSVAQIYQKLIKLINSEMNILCTWFKSNSNLS